jgi:hypothetical protein
VGGAACLEERSRPGPPDLDFTLDAITVRSSPPADTVSGRVQVDDPDGVDSVWITVDDAIKGEDGGFEPAFSSRFVFIVAPGRMVGSSIPVTLRARDLAGFEVSRDTHVVVVP